MELAVANRSIPPAWLDLATADDNVLATLLDVLLVQASRMED